MIVVSDTSAITSLLQVGRVDLLVQVYHHVFIPNAVRDELFRSHPVLPGFLECREVSDIAHVQRLRSELDPGEAEAIVLAKELNADDLLIDEAHGRQIATREGVHVIGLLGVLLEAKGRGLVSSVRQLTAELENEAGFRVSSRVKELIFEAAGE
jgi:predicted nucleic acid-binding protein